MGITDGKKFAMGISKSEICKIERRNRFCRLTAAGEKRSGELSLRRAD